MPACEHDCACQCIHVCTYVRTGSRPPVSDGPHEPAALAPLKGVNYPALFLAWDIILSLHKAEAETGPQKPLRPIVLSLLDKWQAGVGAWEGFKTFMPRAFTFLTPAE